MRVFTVYIMERMIKQIEKNSVKCLFSRLVFLGDPNIEVTDRGQVLRIKSARLGDKARYQCSVMNTAGKQSKDFNLSVYGEFDRSYVVQNILFSMVNICLHN